MPTFEERNAMVAAAVAKFPGEFGLWAYPGHTFRVCPRASYFSDYENSVLLYTQRLCEDGVWKDFAKGTEAELRSQIVRR